MTPQTALIIMITMIMAVAAPFTATAAGPDRIELPAPKMGTVSFPHSLHQKREESCQTCHHKGVEAGACTSCHELSKSPPQGRDLFHLVCRDCHEKQGGPLQCAGCHTRPSK